MGKKGRMKERKATMNEEMKEERYKRQGVKRKEKNEGRE